MGACLSMLEEKWDKFMLDNNRHWVFNYCLNIMDKCLPESGFVKEFAKMPSFPMYVMAFTFNLMWWTCFLYFIVVQYISGLESSFISLDPSSGDCTEVPFSLDGTYLADSSGHWDSQKKYNDATAIYSVDVLGYASTKSQYEALIGTTVGDALKEVGETGARRDLAYNMIAWTAWNYPNRDYGKFTFAMNGEIGTMLDRGYFLGGMALNGDMLAQGDICLNTESSSTTFNPVSGDVSFVIEMSKPKKVDGIVISGSSKKCQHMAKMLGFSSASTASEYVGGFNVNSFASAVAVNYDIMSAKSFVQITDSPTKGYVYSTDDDTTESTGSYYSSSEDDAFTYSGSYGSTYSYGIGSSSDDDYFNIVPTETPTESPTEPPTADPTPDPTAEPTLSPTADPTAAPTPDPTAGPTAGPTAAPTPSPSASPTPEPTAPTAEPTASPSAGPTASPTASPTTAPTPDPTPSPSTRRLSATGRRERPVKSSQHLKESLGVSDNGEHRAMSPKQVKELRSKTIAKNHDLLVAEARMRAEAVAHPQATTTSTTTTGSFLRFYDPKYAQMDPIYCFFTSKTSTRSACFLQLYAGKGASGAGAVYAYPVMKHWLNTSCANMTNDYTTTIQPNGTWAKKAEHNIDMLLGLIVFPKVNDAKSFAADSIKYRSGNYSDGDLVIPERLHASMVALINNNGSSGYSQADICGYNSTGHLRNCFLMTFNAFGTGYYINSHNYQLFAGACRNSVYNAVTFKGITRVVPQPLVQEYVQCTLHPWDSFYQALGFASGNADIYTRWAFYLLMAACIYALYVRRGYNSEMFEFKSPAQEERDTQQRRDREGAKQDVSQESYSVVPSAPPQIVDASSIGKVEQ
jgi:hypothetical protein